MAQLRRRKDNPEARMSLGGHLREFRNRAIISALAILVGCVVGWLYYQNVYDFLSAPIREIAKSHPHDNISVAFNGVTAPFNLKLKVSMWVGFILAAPVWLWQIWAFLLPGLTPKEKRIGGGFLVTALILFAAGVYMGSLTFKNAVELLLGATPDHASNLPDAGTYFSFVTRFILAFGLSFMLPILLLALNMVGVLPGRVMIKGWRIAVIAIATFSAIMTPTPDAWTMFLMSAPLLVLFYGSAGIAILLDKRRAKRTDKELASWRTVPDDQASAL